MRILITLLVTLILTPAHADLKNEPCTANTRLQTRIEHAIFSNIVSAELYAKEHEVYHPSVQPISDKEGWYYVSYQVSEAVSNSTDDCN